MGYRAVTFLSAGTGSSIATISDFWDDGDLIYGFTMNSTGARPISNAGMIPFTGATSPSGTSAGDAAWKIATAGDTSIDCSGGTSTRFHGGKFTGAKTIRHGLMTNATLTTWTVAAMKGIRHGGRVFALFQTETGSRTLSSDDMGLGTPFSSNTTTTTRHMWLGPPDLPSYPGGSFILNGSAEGWLVTGIAF